MGNHRHSSSLIQQLLYQFCTFFQGSNISSVLITLQLFDQNLSHPFKIKKKKQIKATPTSKVLPLQTLLPLLEIPLTFLKSYSFFFHLRSKDPVLTETGNIKGIFRGFFHNKNLTFDVNSFLPGAAFHKDPDHSICCANQITGFYIKCSTRKK